MKTNKGLVGAVCSIVCAAVTFLSTVQNSPAQDLLPAPDSSAQTGTEVGEVDAGALPADAKEEGPAEGGQGMAMSSGGEASGAGATGSGGLRFQPDPFTGRFGYAYPIAVAPARQGAQPNLALAYNSSGGNGWCGMGWSLEAGFIQRETKYGVPIKWGSTAPLSEYDDAKGFVFSVGGAGGTLISVGGNEYRAQIDGAFLKFLFYENYWEVTDKSGNKFYFGETNDPFSQPTYSRMENPKSGWTPGLSRSTFRWALNRVRDVNGNETYLTYALDNNAQYLSAVRYNANINTPALAATHAVEFTLENRSDCYFAFNTGYRVRLNKRLSQVRVKVSGNLARRYALGYTYSPGTGRSLLNSVTMFGTNDTSALPSTTFSYQEKLVGFENSQTWGPIETPNTSYADGSITAYNTGAYVDVFDLDSDGLPDRNSVREVWQPTGLSCGSVYEPQDQLAKHYFWDIQPNTSPGFATKSLYGEVNAFPWYTGLECLISAGTYPRFAALSEGATLSMVADINGDGRLDRVSRQKITLDQYGPNDHLKVQLNTGQGFAPLVNWTNLSAQGSTAYQWGSIRYTSPGQGAYTVVELVDMNGDGLPDRLMRTISGPYTSLKVQFNTGSGFGPVLDWGPVSGADGSAEWNSISSVWADSSDTSHMFVALRDLNGDGLPDRILRSWAGPYTYWLVQFNNGAGFETSENWSPVNGQGYESYAWWGSPEATQQEAKFAALVDINGDGLADRVMRKALAPYTDYIVQLNTGTGFGSTTSAWGPLQGGDGNYGWNSISSTTSDTTYVNMMDVNGDGLPDRILRSTYGPYTNFVVQLNKGPFPDLLKEIQNNVGGKVEVAYVPSTTVDNTDHNGVNQLPFPVHVVKSIVTDDGLGSRTTNSYAYSGGMFEGVKHEFRGFSCVQVTEGLGATSRTYFHQGGGRDDTTNGEYQDQTSVAKKGLPYRIETWGSDGKLYSLTLNKVEEAMLHTNGWCFPYISQTIQMEYDGLTNIYRATAKQLFYDANTGNLTNDTNWGEVTNVVISTHGFTDVAGDSLYTHLTYASLSNADIKNKPATMKITSDAAGNTKLRETRFFYEGTRGNLTNQQAWVSSSSYINTSIITYDQYGNPITVKDAANITTTNFYDSAYQTFVLTNVTATFTNRVSVDERSGAVITAIDAKGLVSSNSYDVFFRLKEAWISTSAYGPASLWIKKLDYNLGGVASGVSYNYVWTRVNDPVDTVYGHDSFTYTDGLGRVVQTRVEAETGQYRTTDTLYDDRGSPNYQTLPYFSSGFSFAILTGLHLGALTEFDAIGRAVRTTPGYQITFDGNGQIISQGATGGDSGSPLASSQVAFVDGTDPWATVTTDSEGKVRKSYHDAYGRVRQIVEVTSAGNYNTYFGYNLVGDLTKVTNHTGKVTTMTYNNLGRKTSMTDPDMGLWSYTYDNAGRLIEQLDAKNNWLKFFYNDPLGRLKTRDIYDADDYNAYYSGNPYYPNATITYTYDSAGNDPDHTVFKGQLYKIQDREGTQWFSYDVRGRVLKSTRYLTKNLQTYTTETTYDDADRPVDVTYPGGVAKIKYTYDMGGNLSQVRSLSGTGTQEIFYSIPVFNEVGQLASVKYGNADANQRTITNLYHANSKRLQRVWTTKPGGGYHQDLAYTYDRVSNVKSITDSVTPAGAASGSITNISYDDLHRLTQMTSVAIGTSTFAYDAIGNVLTNTDLGTGQYTYHATKIHAVTGANGRTYSYDTCGNMISRGTGSGNQSLFYDEENRLIQVSKTGSPTATFGYADDGTRLWRNSTGTGGTGLSVWIGSLYEVRAGKTLCHVFAAGKRIATFEPTGGGPWAKIIGEERWHVWSRTAEAAFFWPFQHGRTPTTVLILTLCGILLASVIGRRGWRWLGGVPLIGRLRTLLPLLGERAGVRADNNDQSAIPNSQFSIVRLRPAPVWQQLVSVCVIAALVLATTNTNVHAQQYDPVFYYYHSDHLGSSSIMTDRNGTLVKHYEYCAFGKERFTSTDPAFAVSHRFTGQILDEDTGLYYYGARYYDPELGRFIQPDTIVPSPDDPQTLNRYTYVNNNPLKYVDPTGEFGIVALLVTVVIYAAIGAALGAAAAAIQGGDVRKGAWEGAISGALGSLGPIGAALSVAVAAARGQDVGKAALIAIVSVVISFGTAQLTTAVIVDGVADTFVETVAYIGVQAAGGAARGAAGAAINDTDVLSGALSGAGEAAASAAGKTAGKWAQRQGSKGLRWGLTKLGKLKLADKLNTEYEGVDVKKQLEDLQKSYSKPLEHVVNRLSEKTDDSLPGLFKHVGGELGKGLAKIAWKNRDGILDWIRGSGTQVQGSRGDALNMNYPEPQRYEGDRDRLAGVALRVDGSK